MEDIGLTGFGSLQLQIGKNDAKGDWHGFLVFLKGWGEIFGENFSPACVNRKWRKLPMTGAAAYPSQVELQAYSLFQNTTHQFST